MSKELECLDRIDKRNYLTEREHKEFLGVVEQALTEYEAIKNAEPTKAMECLDSMYARLPQWDLCRNLDQYNIIKEALKRLEAIDNANPSEALECVEVLKEDGCITTLYQGKALETIRQALLKAQENARSEEILQKYYQEGITLDSVRALKKEMAELKKQAQEPKHYIKWEDLDFKEEEQLLKVKMGDNVYRLDWYIDGLGANVVYIYKYITNDYLAYCACIKDNSQQFFNDLRLERAEE